MKNAELIHYVFMAVAIILEVAANILIKYSEGFRRRAVGLLGIASILASFTALSQVVKGIALSIAYALWGGTGIVLTATAAVVLFKQRLSRTGWLGISGIVAGMVLLRLS